MKKTHKLFNKNTFFALLIILFLIILGKVLFIGNPSTFQVFIGDSILYHKAKKIVNTQVSETQNVTIVDTIKFDNIYLWTLKAGDRRIQIRVLPKYFSDNTSFVITKLNDKEASAECLNKEHSVTLNGILGKKDSSFAMKTGIIFDSLQDIQSNLDKIIATINTWPTKQVNVIATNDVSVLYNCELRVLQ